MTPRKESSLEFKNLYNTMHLEEHDSLRLRSSHQKNSVKKFANFTGKHLYWSLFSISCLFIKKRPQQRYFPVKFAEILRAPILKNAPKWLLLDFCVTMYLLYIPLKTLRHCRIFNDTFLYFCVMYLKISVMLFKKSWKYS